jgi:hypothetical protein
VGLSVVHDVVAQHGGRAWVEDGPAGRGARVVVTLPVPHAVETSARNLSSEDDALDVEGAAPAHVRTAAPARP